MVMLTAESEGGQLKCHPYWKGRDFGRVKLTPLSEKKVSLDIDKYRSDSTSTPPPAAADFARRRANTTTSLELSVPIPQAQSSQSTAPYVIVRKFALSHTAYPFAPIREITHLHFPSWPDFGTPAQPSHLLALVELANVMQRAALPVETSSVVGFHKSSGDGLPISWHDEPEKDTSPRPMLVHCSAGCGRTGTFCTVDSVIDMLKRQRLSNLSAQNSGRDDEGDTAMRDIDEPISPMTMAEPRFQFPGQPVTPKKRKSPEPANSNMSWAQGDDVDLIQKTVEDFREQRLSMVQSLRQYVLCYETILEWITRMNERSATAPDNAMKRSGSLDRGR